MTKEEVAKIIAEKLAQAEALVRECEVLGKEHNVTFNWGLAYGMGGWFGPEYDWDASDGGSSESNDNREWGWQSSSHLC